jgi:hypothetical protein
MSRISKIPVHKLQQEKIIKIRTIEIIKKLNNKVCPSGSPSTWI